MLSIVLYERGCFSNENTPSHNTHPHTHAGTIMKLPYPPRIPTASYNPCCMFSTLSLHTSSMEVMFHILLTTTTFIKRIVANACFYLTAVNLTQCIIHFIAFHFLSNFIAYIIRLLVSFNPIITVFMNFHCEINSTIVDL